MQPAACCTGRRMAGREGLAATGDDDEHIGTAEMLLSSIGAELSDSRSPEPALRHPASPLTATYSSIYLSAHTPCISLTGCPTPVLS